MRDIVPAADCWCLDLCNRDLRKIEDFVRRTRGVVLASPTSPWFQYFDAIYKGATPRPFDLWGVDTFYQNTAMWRYAYPSAANPFRDCEGTAQPRCSEETCALWTHELVPKREEATGKIMLLLWPTWANMWDSHYFHVCQLVTQSTSSLGHATFPNNTWMEIMRSDARPMFQEGAVAPECYRKGGNPFKLGEPRPEHGFLPTCYENLAAMGGGQPFLPGCWARPAVGSGIWINSGKTLLPDSLEEVTLTVLKAAGAGHQTIQFEFGDEIPAYAPAWHTEKPGMIRPGL
eukprot:3474354-Prymnesium_polylepis.1